jgi:hypothetical protein
MPRPARLTPEEVAARQAAINRQVARYEQLTAAEFADRLSDNLKDSADLAALGDRPIPDDLPLPEDVRIREEAFRSDKLAFQTRAALRLMIDSVNSQLNSRDMDATARRRATNFRNRVGYERRIVDAVCAGIQARTGVLPNQPNPRQRAFEELAKRHPEEYIGILREKQAEAQERARLEKEQRKEAARKRKRAAPST